MKMFDPEWMGMFMDIQNFIKEQGYDPLDGRTPIIQLTEAWTKVYPTRTKNFKGNSEEFIKQLEGFKRKNKDLVNKFVEKAK